MHLVLRRVMCKCRLVWWADSSSVWVCCVPQLVQALFCLGDLVWDHAQLQEQLAGQLAAAPAAVGRGQAQPQPIPYLQVCGSLAAALGFVRGLELDNRVQGHTLWQAAMCCVIIVRGCITLLYCVCLWCTGSAAGDAAWCLRVGACGCQPPAGCVLCEQQPGTDGCAVNSGVCRSVIRLVAVSHSSWRRPCLHTQFPKSYCKLAAGGARKSPSPLGPHRSCTAHHV